MPMAFISFAIQIKLFFRRFDIATNEFDFLRNKKNESNKFIKKKRQRKKVYLSIQIHIV